jgi:hypothetical protein
MPSYTEGHLRGGDGKRVAISAVWRFHRLVELAR